MDAPEDFFGGADDLTATLFAGKKKGRASRTESEAKGYVRRFRLRSACRGSSAQPDLHTRLGTHRIFESDSEGESDAEMACAGAGGLFGRLGAPAVATAEATVVNDSDEDVDGGDDEAAKRTASDEHNFVLGGADGEDALPPAENYLPARATLAAAAGTGRSASEMWLKAEAENHQPPTESEAAAPAAIAMSASQLVDAKVDAEAEAAALAEQAYAESAARAAAAIAAAESSDEEPPEPPPFDSSEARAIEQEIRLGESRGARAGLGDVYTVPSKASSPGCAESSSEYDSDEYTDASTTEVRSVV